MASKHENIAVSRARFDLGLSYLKERQTIQALREFIEAEKLNPDDPEIQNTLAMTYFEKKVYDKAEEHLRKALIADPKYSEAWNNLGTVYRHMGQPDEAVNCYEKALEDVLYVTPERALFNLGMIYFERGLYTKALEYFVQAYEANKLFAVTRYYLGVTNMKLGRKKEACFHLCFVTTFFPDGDIKLEAENSLKKLRCKCPSKEELIIRK